VIIAADDAPSFQPAARYRSCSPAAIAYAISPPSLASPSAFSSPIRQRHYLLPLLPPAIHAIITAG
jgi:hypothetical protein